MTITSLGRLFSPSGRSAPREVATRFPHRNNFDLIRLIAATQVILIHAVENLGLKLPYHHITVQIFYCFPGVPIFFCVSGFLISASCQRSGSLRDFFTNRALRIFPALWLCFALSVASIAITGYFAREGLSIKSFLVWAGTQLTVLQVYHPAFLRAYGVGVLNGSLWTIPVEMQFYVLTPLLVAIFFWKRWAFWTLITIFAAVNLVFIRLSIGHTVSTFLMGVMESTFVPWIYMFMLGAAANLLWSRIRFVVEGRFLFWLAAYSILIAMHLAIGSVSGANSAAAPWLDLTNSIAPPAFLILGGLTLSAAFTFPQLAEQLLRRNDISYGVYIYHMPLYNFALQLGLKKGGAATWLLLPVVFVIASLSWIAVERPALGLKRRTLLQREQRSPPLMGPPTQNEQQPCES